jgi:hypothetical protein
MEKYACSKEEENVLILLGLIGRENKRYLEFFFP